MATPRPDETPTHVTTPVQLPRGAKPIGRLLIQGVGVTLLAAILEPNAWPAHEHPHHWQIVICFAPGCCKASWTRANGRRTRRSIFAGEVWLLPPSRRHAVEWTAKAPVIVLYVESASVAECFKVLRREDSVVPLETYISLQPGIAEHCEEVRRLGLVEKAPNRWGLAGAGTELTVSILAAHAKWQARKSDPRAGAGEQIVEKAMRQIAASLPSLPTGEHLARNLGVSGRHFRRLFLRVTAQSLREYLQTARTKYAIRLLKNGTHNVKAAAEAAGFADPSHLFRYTKKFYGVSPSAFVPGTPWPRQP